MICDVFGYRCDVDAMSRCVYKMFVIFSELGALGLLFLILDLTMTCVIHLNIAER